MGGVGGVGGVGVGMGMGGLGMGGMGGLGVGGMGGLGVGGMGGLGVGGMGGLGVGGMGGIGGVGGVGAVGAVGGVGGTFGASGIVGTPVGGTFGAFPTGGTPMGGTPMGGTPMGGTPMGGTPMGGTPMGGTPMGGTPMGGTPMGGTCATSTQDSCPMVEAFGACALGGTLATVKLLRERWQEHHNTLSSRTNQRSFSLAELTEIVLCAGCVTVVAICERLAEGYSAWRGGMPDLVLWRTRPAEPQLRAELQARMEIRELNAQRRSEWLGAIEPRPLPSGFFKGTRGNWGGGLVGGDRGNYWGEVKLVEVKGPRDELSCQQTEWLRALQGDGVDHEEVEVKGPRDQFFLPADCLVEGT
ncbi:unnamed protein product [Closterium sp. Yama58-4]|nr:unnamed protein product [Closterium sp. Yama58-4]